MIRQHTRILMVEDSPDDAELVERELRRADFDFSVRRIETEQAMRAALETSDPDVILADYHLPEFDGIGALKVARALAPEIPFIFVSGSIGEERAIQALREGATDYILKDRLSRLPVAISRALAERREQQLRRRAQEALQSSEERFRYAARATQEVIWDLDLRSEQVSFSEAIAAWGWKIEEQVDRNWFFERVHPDDRASIADSFQATLDGTAERWAGEYRFRHADGRYAFVYDRALIMRDRMQRPTRVIGAMLDVTEQRAAEARVRESEIRFRSVAETALEAIIVTDARGTILFWNAAATAMFGYPAPAAFTTDVLELMDPRVRAELSRAIDSTQAAAGDHPEVRTTAIRRDQSFVPIAIALSCWEAGGERFCTWIVRDITEQVASERRRAMELAVTRTLATDGDSRSVAERLLSSIGSDLGFQLATWFSVDAAAGVLRCERIWTAPGFDAPELIGSAKHLALHPGEGLGGKVWETGLAIALDDAPPTVRDEARAAGIRRSIAFPIIETGGVTAVVALFSTDERLSAASLAAGAEAIGRTIGSFLERHRAEEELRRGRSQLAEAQRIAQLGSYTWDPPTGVVRWSAQMYRIYGVADGEFAGTLEDFCRFVHPDDRARWIEGMIPPIKDEERDFRIVRADGDTRTVRCRLRVVEGTSEAPLHVVGTVQDITDQRRLERQVEQANRVSSLGRVAATIAHEFNNVLMGIQPVAEVIRMRSAGDEKIARSVGQILDAVSRGRRVTESILRFTQPAEPALQPTLLNDWLQRIWPELQALAGQRAVVSLDLPDVPVTVACDTAQFHQVLSNLVLNAADAMSANGRITISLRRLGGMHGVRAVLTVADNGNGMPESVLENIFEPLFTTKRTGTGLGLAVVQQIVVRHGGGITVESGAGQGSEFRIELPIVADAPSEASPRETVAVAARRVLLVEDDATIADGLAALFESEGVECRSVTLGAEATRAVASFGPDAVILDLGLPDMSGIEVYDRIRSRWPTLPVVFSTGHGDEAVLESQMANGHVGFIRKPYDFDTLKSVLNEVAGAHGAGVSGEVRG